MATTARGYRNEASCIEGFNLCILDVDGNVSIKMVELLLARFKYFLYTTKRHTPENNRFRVILPMSHTLKLSREDYKAFMKNVFNFLPFPLDEQTGTRSKKWLTNQGTYKYNDGKLFDVLPFIPKTKEADKRQEVYTTYSNLTHLERWVVANAGDVGRNNTLFQYACVCIDLDQDISLVKSNILNLNSKLDKPLPEHEIYSTIFSTVDRKITARDLKK